MRYTCFFALVESAAFEFILSVELRCCFDYLIVSFVYAGCSFLSCVDSLVVVFRSDCLIVWPSGGRCTRRDTFQIILSWLFLNGGTAARP